MLHKIHYAHIINYAPYNKLCPISGVKLRRNGTERRSRTFYGGGTSYRHFIFAPFRFELERRSTNNPDCSKHNKSQYFKGKIHINNWGGGVPGSGCVTMGL